MDTLPRSLIWHGIIPFIPAFGLTQRILEAQRRRIYALSIIKGFAGLSDDEMRLIMREAESFDFNDGDAFSYEEAGMYIEIDITNDPNVIMIVW